MYNRLLSIKKKHDILYEHQYGFQAGKSTELAINSLLGNITEAFEEKKKTICIFLDFAKTFDTVNHQMLLKKLYYYGIRGHAIKWFESYLSNRRLISTCLYFGTEQDRNGKGKLELIST